MTIVRRELANGRTAFMVKIRRGTVRENKTFYTEEEAKAWRSMRVAEVTADRSGISRYTLDVLALTKLYPALPAPQLTIAPDSKSSLIPEVPGVYVGYRDGECWYVGQSVNLRDRLTERHHALRRGDLLTLLEMPNADEAERKRAEAWYTAVLAPVHFMTHTNKGR